MRKAFAAFSWIMDSMMSCWMDPRLVSNFQLKILQQPLWKLNRELAPLFGFLFLLYNVGDCMPHSTKRSLSLSLPLTLGPVVCVVAGSTSCRTSTTPSGAAACAWRGTTSGAGGTRRRRTTRTAAGATRGTTTSTSDQINLSKHALSLLSCRMHLASPIDNPICVSVPTLSCVCVLRMVRAAATTC